MAKKDVTDSSILRTVQSTLGTVPDEQQPTLPIDQRSTQSVAAVQKSQPTTPEQPVAQTVSTPTDVAEVIQQGQTVTGEIVAPVEQPPAPSEQSPVVPLHVPEHLIGYPPELQFPVQPINTLLPFPPFLPKEGIPVYTLYENREDIDADTFVQNAAAAFYREHGKLCPAIVLTFMHRIQLPKQKWNEFNPEPNLIKVYSPDDPEVRDALITVSGKQYPLAYEQALCLGSLPELPQQ